MWAIQVTSPAILLDLFILVGSSVTNTTKVNWLTADIVLPSRCSHTGFLIELIRKLKEEFFLTEDLKIAIDHSTEVLKHDFISFGHSSHDLIRVLVWPVTTWEVYQERISSDTLSVWSFFRGRIMEWILISDFVSTQAGSNATVLTSRFVFCLFMSILLKTFIFKVTRIWFKFDLPFLAYLFCVESPYIRNPINHCFAFGAGLPLWSVSIRPNRLDGQWYIEPQVSFHVTCWIPW